MTRIELEHININLVASSELTALEDCCVYLISDRDSSILVDTGAGSERWITALCRNIEDIIPLTEIHYVLVTHAHIDHVGGLKAMKSRLSRTRIIAHSYAADVIANEDPILSAAHWYKTTLQAVDIDIKITNRYSIQLAEGIFQILPTPGHTPGSIVGLLKTENHCVLFGQDIHD